MAAIDWIKLLNTNHIEYITKGSGVKKGNVVVACPFCGGSEWHYMGIELDTGYWGCWRNKSHRGKSPVRLLMALLKVSYETARDIAGLDESYADPEGYEAIKHNLFKKHAVMEVETDETIGRKIMELPREFEEISPTRVRHERFIRYLVEKRGFEKQHIMELCRMYRLKAAVSGMYKDRIIMPYTIGSDVVSWTGRAIADTTLRYLDLSEEESVVPPKHTLYNFNVTRRPDKILLVHEGPFDAVKVDYYGHQLGVRSVALSTNSITEDQIYLLEEVSVNFKKVLMVMDSANSVGVVDSYRLKEQLAQIRNIGFAKIPAPFKDGGDMPRNSVIKFVKGLL